MKKLPTDFWKPDRGCSAEPMTEADFRVAFQEISDNFGKHYRKSRILYRPDTPIFRLISQQIEENRKRWSESEVKDEKGNLQGSGFSGR